jgi:hypothetical protein
MYKASVSRLGGVVVSVLATGPKLCGFETDQGYGFLRAIKIRSTPSKSLRNTGIDIILKNQFLSHQRMQNACPLQRFTYIEGVGWQDARAFRTRHDATRNWRKLHN